MRKLILAIDFNNVLFASYYGNKLINSKGHNVNAIKGFFFKLRSLKEIFDPDFIVFASDIGREKLFRKKLYPDYKAQRKPKDDDIMWQISTARRMIGLLGFKNRGDSVYEADDILGMISRLGEDMDMDTIIISSDRDMYQLVTDHTMILSPRNDDLVDRQFMMNHYQLTPKQWVDLKILQGDPSDNIPGIPGIGNMTAMDLMHTYGSIDKIYSVIESGNHNIKPKVVEKLITNRDIIPLTRELVTIITDYKQLNLTDEDLHRTTPFVNELYDFMDELELYSLFNVMNYSLLPYQGDKVEVFCK